MIMGLNDLANQTMGFPLVLEVYTVCCCCYLTRTAFLCHFGTYYCNISAIFR